MSLKTYNTLSPDLRLRQQVSRQLQHRPEVILDEWYEQFYYPQGIDKTIAAFAYTYLARYSGLPMSRILPTDRLEEDLHWTQICWFDWETTLSQDFYQVFGIDISHWSYWSYQCNVYTIGELIYFLNWMVQEQQREPDENQVELDRKETR